MVFIRDYLRGWLVFLLALAPAGALRAQSAPPRVVINEIHYHPASEDRREEWIELFNAGQRAVELGGWKLEGEVHFEFPSGARLAPRGYAVVAADRERVRDALELPSVLGNWTGSLGRGRGSLRLLDPARKDPVDRVEYRDRHPFPVAPDGSGVSLERRSPEHAGDDPANWGASRGETRANPAWERVRVRGIATSDRFYIYLLGAGTAHVDGIHVRPGPDSVPGGPDDTADVDGLEEQIGLWLFTGTHQESGLTGERARIGTRSLRVRAAAAGGSSRSSAFCRVPSILVGREYTLECWIYREDPDVPLAIRFSGSRLGGPGISFATTMTTARSFTPGAENSIRAATLPPVIHAVEKRAHAADPTGFRVEALISSAASLEEVSLHYDAGQGERRIALARLEGAGEAGRVRYGGAVGPLVRGTPVRYWVTATDATGSQGRYPLAGDPTSARGHFASPSVTDSKLPVYQLFLSPQALNALNRSPQSDVYQTGTLVYDGEVFCDIGIRYRGQTSRYYPKRHWKLRFNRDQRFAPSPGHPRVRSINLKSAYVDKIYIREKLAYDLLRDLGEPYCETRFVRATLNGEFLGLYLEVENPGERFLRRNGLESGWLWKAYAPGHGEGRLPTRSSRGFLGGLFGSRPPAQDPTRPTTFGGIRGFELKAGEPKRAPELLTEFLQGVNSLRGEKLEAFIRERMDVDSFVNYLVANQLMHNADHIEKNYLVYASPAGRFTCLGWDLDLTHGRNFEIDGYITNDSIRADMWDGQFGDEKLLAGTLVHPKCDGPWNAVINAFLAATEAFREPYYRRLAEGLRHYYHPAILIPKAERLRERIRDEVPADRSRWGTYPGESSFDRRFERFKSWVKSRHAHLEGKLRALGHSVGKPLNADFRADRSHGPSPLTVRLENLSVGSIERVHWNFGDGGESRQRNPSHTYAAPGVYDISLEVSGPDGEHRTLRRACVRVLESP